MTFKERLKLLIKEHNCTYTDIEKATGIKHYIINSYINGNVEPDVDSIIKLCQYFEVSSDYLVGYIDNIFPKEIGEAFNAFKILVKTSFDDFNIEIAKILNT